ncbi:MAG TPA: rhomboid family intramembrane serine protease, partial [Micromonosporaceae bacterium]|nr:rhomboid family intramembrane serine protease [Micromonosporaceae bacterium]
GSIVIGASGVVFGYLGYLLCRGLVEHSWWNIGVAVLIGLVYGWQITGILPGDSRISWQGHLFGFLGGALAAIVFRRRGLRTRATGDPADREPDPAPAGGA